MNGEAVRQGVHDAVRQECDEHWPGSQSIAGAIADGVSEAIWWPDVTEILGAITADVKEAVSEYLEKHGLEVSGK